MSYPVFRFGGDGCPVEGDVVVVELGLFLIYLCIFQKRVVYNILCMRLVNLIWDWCV